LTWLGDIEQQIYGKCLFPLFFKFLDVDAHDNDGYNVKGLKLQIMTLQESRKTKNIKKNTFLIFM
jgi:hypothetical protein